MNHSDKPSSSSIIKKRVSSSQIANRRREYSHIKMSNLPNGQPIASSSIAIKQTNTHRSCLKHRPDGSYQRKTNWQSSSILPEDDRTGRLSTGGNTSGRVSFAHAALSDGKILQESPLTFHPGIDSTEKKRRSAVFTKKAKELQSAELTYFKDHARDVQTFDE